MTTHPLKEEYNNYALRAKIYFVEEKREFTSFDSSIINKLRQLDTIDTSDLGNSKLETRYYGGLTSKVKNDRDGKLATNWEGLYMVQADIESGALIL